MARCQAVGKAGRPLCENTVAEGMYYCPFHAGLPRPGTLPTERPEAPLGLRPATITGTSGTKDTRYTRPRHYRMKLKI